MKYLSESGKVAVEIYFSDNDVIRMVDCKCGDAFDTLKAILGNRLRDGAYLKDNLGVLSRDTMLSDASGNVWIINGAEKGTSSVCSMLIGIILCQRSNKNKYSELRSGIPRLWFNRRPLHSVVPDCVTLSPKLLQVRQPNLA